MAKLLDPANLDVALSLAGRTALVTGGASGIGRAIAQSLARRGANIAIGSRLHTTNASTVRSEYTYLPSPEELELARSEIEDLGVGAVARGLDVRSEASARELFGQAVRAFGSIDILVNAAGVCAYEPMAQHSEEVWQSVLDVNLTGPFRMIRLCFPNMVARRWGRIVNIASTAAAIGSSGYAAYCSSKAGLLGMSRCVALEGAPHNISCNCISPGYIETRFSRAGSELAISRQKLPLSVDEYRARIAAENPQRRPLHALEVGALAAYLCSDLALGVTGENITLSGGSLW